MATSMIEHARFTDRAAAGRALAAALAERRYARPVVLALGIVVGGIFTWLGQGKTRARARYHRREAVRYEREATRLRTYAPESETVGPYTVPNTGRTALPAPR